MACAFLIDGRVEWRGVCCGAKATQHQAKPRNTGGRRACRGPPCRGRCGAGDSIVDHIAWASLLWTVCGFVDHQWLKIRIFPLVTHASKMISASWGLI